MSIKLRYSKNFFRNKIEKSTSELLINKVSTQDIFNLLFSVIDKTISAIYSYNDYLSINTEDLKKYIIEIYLNDLYNVFEDFMDNVDNLNDIVGIPFEIRHEYNINDDNITSIGSNLLFTNFYITEEDYNNFSPSGLLRSYDRFITEEHQFSAKDFRQKKGLNQAFEYMYGIVKNIDSVENFDYIKTETKKDEFGNNIPFEYKIKSIIHGVFYDEVIKNIVHPAGFNGEYTRIMPLNFSDNISCDREIDYSIIFYYNIDTNKYYDVRYITANDLNIWSEIKEVYRYTILNKHFLMITLENGYIYTIDYNNILKLYDNNGNLVKNYKTETSLIPITAYIDDKRVEDLDVTDSDGNNIKGFFRVLGMSFNDNHFLELNDCTITLNNHFFYRIINGKATLYDDAHNSIKVYDNKQVIFKNLIYKCINKFKDKQFWNIKHIVETILYPGGEPILVGQGYTIDSSWFINGVSRPITTGMIRIYDTFSSFAAAKVIKDNFVINSLPKLKSIFKDVYNSIIVGNITKKEKINFRATGVWKILNIGNTWNIGSENVGGYMDPEHYIVGNPNYVGRDGFIIDNYRLPENVYMRDEFKIES